MSAIVTGLVLLVELPQVCSSQLEDSVSTICWRCGMAVVPNPLKRLVLRVVETVTVDFVEWTTPGFCSYVVVAKAGMVFIDRAQEKTNLFRIGTGGAQPQSCLMRAEHGNPVLVRPASVGMAVSRR
jgi:hypothetical protein